MATLCNPPPTWFHPRSGPPILPRRCHRRPEHRHQSHHWRPEFLSFNPLIRRVQQRGNRYEFPARMSRERVLIVKPCVCQGPLEPRRAARRVSENNLPLLPLNVALVNEGRTFAAAKAKVQPRPGFAADAASGPGSKQTVNQFRRRLSRKKKQMKQSQTNERGIAAGQPFKPTTPIGIY